MATFYILPTRERLEHEITAFWSRTLPGLAVPPGLASWFLERIEQSQANAYFVHREDLPGSSSFSAELAEHFGAEPGDEVVALGAAGVSENRFNR